MSIMTHEDIRVKVAQFLRDLLKEFIRERPVLDFYSQTLLNLLDSPEITVLMPQEIRVGVEKKRVDMALGTAIVFEFKINEREFYEAERAAKERYWPIVSKAKIFYNY